MSGRTVGYVPDGYDSNDRLEGGQHRAGRPSLSNAAPARSLSPPAIGPFAGSGFLLSTPEDLAERVSLVEKTGWCIHALA
jgi:hypothetical protein